MEIRRKVLEKTAEISDRIFSDVRIKLEEYMKTPAYEELLCVQIRKVIDFASKGDQITIYINPTDADKKARLEEKTGVSLTVSNRDFIGGSRAVIPSRSILIDNSFFTKLEEAKSSFTL
jgi:vacuolar-type H+-ATPase subunit E/Vma4